MGDVDIRELLVDLIGYASIVSAAIFGLIGLFTEYKKNGKVTVWGRLAAGGIGLSALLAMTSAVLQKQLNAEQQQKARNAAANERGRQQKQFNVQLRELTGLNRQMGGVNKANGLLLGRMENSLASQRLLLGNAQRNLLLTTALGAQQRESTSRVLLGLWNESTRVTIDRIEARVVSACESIHPAFPGAVLDSAVAILRAVPLAKAEPYRPFDKFVFGPRLPEDGIRLVSMNPVVSVQPGGEVQSGVDLEFATFSSFKADNPIPERPEDWEGLALELFVMTSPPDLAANVAKLGSKVSGKEALSVLFTVPPDLRDDSSKTVTVLPCALDMEFILNGRTIASSSGLFVLGRGPDGGVLLAAEFRIVETRQNVFPRFSQTGVAR